MDRPEKASDDLKKCSEWEAQEEAQEEAAGSAREIEGEARMPEAQMPEAQKAEEGRKRGTTQETEDTVVNIFKLLDTDNDEFLSQDEYKRFLDVIGLWGKGVFTDAEPKHWDEVWTIEKRTLQCEGESGITVKGLTFLYKTFRIGRENEDLKDLKATTLLKDIIQRVKDNPNPPTEDLDTGVFHKFHKMCDSFGFPEFEIPRKDLEVLLIDTEHLNYESIRQEIMKAPLLAIQNFAYLIQNLKTQEMTSDLPQSLLQLLDLMTPP